LLQNIIVNGLICGGNYAVLAAGFALVFGVARILNMAHTAFYMVAAYIIYTLIHMLMLGINPILVSIIAIIAATGLAIVCYILFIDRVKQHDLTVMVITIAIGMLFQEIILLIFHNDYRGVAPFIQDFIDIGNIRISYQNITILVASIVVLILIWLLLTKTRLGTAIRAVSQDRVAANLMGINVGRIILAAVALSAAFAAFAGSVVAPNLALYPQMWMQPLTTILAAVVLGGLGSLKGAIIGAFILGMVESVVVFLVPLGGYLREAVALVTMLIVLTVRSEGLFGIVFEEEKL
jgi:branched-chain amino acid transport system permease protein